MEAIEILLQVMENDRDKLVVILAGYKDRMDDFFRLNPGMSSRVAHHIDFPDYTVDELMSIGELMLAGESYEFSPGAEQAFREYLELRISQPRFAHARSVRNAIERARLRHANRVYEAAQSGSTALHAGPDADRGARYPCKPGVRRNGEELMPRPVILGVVGDSAAGKTTLTRGLVRVLGEENVTHVCTDDYHRYDRKQRAELGMTPLSPDCNYLDIIAQHLVHLRNGEPILKPVYRHQDGTFGPPVYVKPERFTLIEGLFGYYLPEMRDVYDVRVYLNPPEEVRRRWKVQRDCSRRGYTTDQVLTELDRREADSEAYIRPQRRWADMLVAFTNPEGADQTHMDAELTLYPGLPHPDLTPFVNNGDDGPTITEGDGCRLLRIPGKRRFGSGGGDRGGDLEPDALRHPPARAPAR